jgi:formylglycine-generating enzyme required for sulfatase activity
MRLIRGGAFAMGSDAFYEDEKPVRRAVVGDFRIDETPVTNDAFARFVADTGHVTSAEHAPRPEDYPGMPPHMARTGSAVFEPPTGPDAIATIADDGLAWWRFVFGADWRHPLGPHSSLDGLGAHPVVHVTAADADAYAAWAGKTLPTEAEWEYAARGGLDGAAYAWGETFEPDGQAMAKTWRGLFPTENLAPPGLERTAPVRSYPANGYGLFDMIGNVWEWTADSYVTPDAPAGVSPCCGSGRPEADAPSPMPRRVLKGGSHLCAPSYCRRYRPAARWPQAIDTSTSHVGFRCIVRA